MTEIAIEFPDYSYRGLTDPSWIDSTYSCVLGEAFHFDGNHKNENGYDELSINWADNDNSLNYLKTLKREDADRLKYSAGIARLPTIKLKEMKNKYLGNFSYERKPIDGNEYHGNLLISNDILQKKALRKMISSELAINVDLVYKFNEEDSLWYINNQV
ncbi:MAG: hypothetical protein IJ220_04700 [Clostridia bacterium]|nr:hypothetical protein [Clostridia bacterium]